MKFWIAIINAKVNLHDRDFNQAYFYCENSVFYLKLHIKFIS